MRDNVVPFLQLSVVVITLPRKSGVALAMRHRLNVSSLWPLATRAAYSKSNYPEHTYTVGF